MTNEEFLDGAASLMENIFTLTPEALLLNSIGRLKKRPLIFLVRFIKNLKIGKNEKL